MNAEILTQLVTLGALLAVTSIPVGLLLARVYGAAPWPRWLRVERVLLRACGADPEEDMPWPRYATAVLAFNMVGALVVYGILRMQGWLPWNPAGLPGVDPWVAFNTAASFVSNTNWQAYSGESRLSPFSQAVALGTQNFASAATGLAVMAALVRGFTRHGTDAVGNFWRDLVRGVVLVFLPLSAVLAMALVSQGVVQTTEPGVPVHVLQPGSGGDVQVVPLGPVASQVAIKQLGTNGGGYYGVNSAHPLENPTPLSNLLELLAILLVPVAAPLAFGRMVGAPRQGLVLLAAMGAVFVPMLAVAWWAEAAGNPALALAGVDVSAGNMEGKETRFGVFSSVLWSVATTAASNGSVNAMHDSFTPLAGMVQMVLMQLGEVVFGGVGSGLYGMLMFALLAVFIAGLMVGRTPEYLGKKIEAFEVKMACLVVLVPAAATLLGTAVAAALPAGTEPLGNPGIHGFSEMLYAFSSAANNNGSAFGGLDASGSFYATLLGWCMLVGRYMVIIPVLAVAGSLARKKTVPASSGTLPTDTPLFAALLAGTVVLVGALTFIPALALGPVAEHMQLQAGAGGVP